MSLNKIRNLILLFLIVLGAMVIVMFPEYANAWKLFGGIWVLWSIKIFLDFIFGLTMIGPYTGKLLNTPEFRSRRIQLFVLNPVLLAMGVFFLSK